MTASEWGRRPRDWADLAEPSNRPLFAEVLKRLRVGPGTGLLDIGCGSGYAAQMAVELGASVTGIDITPELLAIARKRLPQGHFRQAGMDDLPFPDNTFEVAVGFNAFQFADDPARAVREAWRVVRPGGLVAATTFAEAERNESTALHLALEPLRSGGAHQHLPYELSASGGLERLLIGAGLELVESGEVSLAWENACVEDAVRAVLASGGGAMAIEAAGEAAARAALERAVVPFRRADGRVTMRNVFRFAIGRKPAD